MAEDLAAYKDLYLQTSKEYLQELNSSLLKLEKDPLDKTAIEDIFRSAHSLKSQSAAMGYTSTAFLCHTIEDVFYEIKEDKLVINSDIADVLFSAFDNLSSSIESIEKNNQELDSAQLVEKLKTLTGVKTEGIGKSIRNQAPQVSGPSKAPVKTIAVKVSVLDDLMNLVEELMLKHYDSDTQKILENLQYKVMQARAISVSVVFEHFPRTIRDLAHSQNKSIELKISGEDLELDRTIVDRLDEPLIHILRNSVGHGIEKEGIITLEASREKDYAIISVSDNGVGIDWEKLATKAGMDYASLSLAKKNALLFSGISTSDQITEISGRGVGMKVVKKMVEDFGGKLEVISEKGQGTKIILKLPLTLAIVKAIMIKSGISDYAIPSLLIDRIVSLNENDIKTTADQDVFVLDATEIPLLDLEGILTKKNRTKTPRSTVVVVTQDNERVGLYVDKVSQTEDIVVKELPKSLRNLKYYSGTTITSNGGPALVLNPQGLLK